VKIKVVEYSRLFSFGNYQNERIGFQAEIDETSENEKAVLGKLYMLALKLNEAFQDHRNLLNRIDCIQTSIEHCKERIKDYERYIVEFLKDKEIYDERYEKEGKPARILCQIQSIEERIQEYKRKIAEEKQRILELEKEFEEKTRQLKEIEEKIREGKIFCEGEEE